jgi:hypothetical protein
MPDEEPNEPDPKPAKDKDPEPPADLGDAGKAALDKERKARRDAEKQSADLAARLKQLEDKDKSETDKLRDENATLTKENERLGGEILRRDIASDKGLTLAQAKRLHGATREELEADADEFLTENGPAKDETPAGDRPKERLKSGAVPDAEPEETDPAKLAAMVSPNGF